MRRLYQTVKALVLLRLFDFSSERLLQKRLLAAYLFLNFLYDRNRVTFLITICLLVIVYLLSICLSSSLLGVSLSILLSICIGQTIYHIFPSFSLHFNNIKLIGNLLSIVLP